MRARSRQGIGIPASVAHGRTRRTRAGDSSPGGRTSRNAAAAGPCPGHTTPRGHAPDEMPYTLAHPAAVVPLHPVLKGRLRLAALVIGSTTPDYQYFLRLYTEGGFSHTLPELLLVCLPAGWLTLWLFDRFGWRGLATLLPPGWQLPASPTPAYSPVPTSGWSRAARCRRRRHHAPVMMPRREAFSVMRCPHRGTDRLWGVACGEGSSLPARARVWS